MGENKAAMIKECVEGPISDTIPASYLQTHNNAHVAIDLSASMNLTRIQRPWLVTSCEWNDKLIRSAIVWLCQLTEQTDSEADQQGLQRKRSERTSGIVWFCLQCKYQDFQRLAAYHHRMAGWQT